MLTDEWIEEQLELCAKATPGPWQTYGAEVIVYAHPSPTICNLLEANGSYSEWLDNAEFIAAARENYSLVLKEMQQLRRVIWSAHEDLMEGESGHAAKTLDDDREPGTKSYYG